MDAFVHASGDGFGNTAPLRSDTGAIDMDAISQVAHVTQGAGKLTRKEKKHAKREMKRRKKEAKKAEKEAKKTYSSIKSQLKDRDKELSDKMADARKKRDSAKDVVNYIGYNKMYQDGICEVEEGICDYASAARRILETIRQRFRRPAAPRPKTQVPVSAEPNGNLIVELVHRIFRRFRFQIEYHAVFVLSRVVVSRHIHDSFPSTRQAL